MIERKAHWERVSGARLECRYARKVASRPKSADTPMSWRRNRVALWRSATFKRREDCSHYNLHWGIDHGECVKDKVGQAIDIDSEERLQE